VEVLVAQTALDVLRRRGVLVSALSQDVAFLVESVDPTSPLGVHQVGRVPTARGIEDDVVRSLIGLRPLVCTSQRRKGERHGNAEAGKAAQLEEIASVRQHDGYS